MITAALSVVSLRDLSLVHAVYRKGSFNSAARTMHISPSGLSHQVQKVEQALGVPLFERGGRKIGVTGAGQLLLQQIEALLLGAERLQDMARGGQSAFGGELKLGLPISLGPYFLPHFLEPFKQRFPTVDLQLSESKARGLLRRLHEGELDAVLAPPLETASGIVQQTVFFEPWALLLAADHPLAGSRALSLDLLDPGEARLLAESQAEGLPVAGRTQDISLESLAGMVGRYGGYALVPALAAERLASVQGVWVGLLGSRSAGRNMALYWRDASPWREDLVALAGLLSELAARSPVLHRATGKRTAKKSQTVFAKLTDDAVDG